MMFEFSSYLCFVFLSYVQARTANVPSAERACPTPRSSFSLSTLAKLQHICVQQNLLRARRLLLHDPLDIRDTLVEDLLQGLGVLEFLVDFSDD